MNYFSLIFVVHEKETADNDFSFHVWRIRDLLAQY